MHVVVNIYHIIWTILHVVVPAGENRKDKTAVQNENENEIGTRKKARAEKQCIDEGLLTTN